MTSKNLALRHPYGGTDAVMGDGDSERRPLIKKETGQDVMNPDKLRRLQCRLMTSIFMTLVFYIMGLLALVPLQSQYLFHRFAVEEYNLTNVSMSQGPCAVGKNDSTQKLVNEIQKRTSQQILWLEYAQFIPGVFLSLIAGSYADYLGRKFLVVLPLIGGFCKTLVFCLVIYLPLDINYLFLAYGLDGITGSFYVLLLGLSAAIADVTTSSTQRVLFFAVLSICLAGGGAISEIGTGFLIGGFGFSVPAVVICCLLFLGCVIIIFFMPETLHKKPEHFVLNPAVHLRKVFGFYLFDGTALQRCAFILGLVIFFLITMIDLGKMAVETLYMLNAPFCWGSVKIGIFTGLRLFVQNIAGVVVLKYLSSFVRIEIIGVLGLLSGVASFSIEAFAKSDLMMYISAVVGVLVTIVSPIARTLMSRMAPPERQGALFASLSALETVCHLTSTTLYTQIYNITIDVFAGAVFLVMVGILLLNVILLGVFSRLSHKVPTIFSQEFEVDAEDNSTDASSPESRIANNETDPLLHSTRSTIETRSNDNRLTSSC